MLNIKHNKSNFSRVSGFTLIELMVAMLIGLIIMGGVMKLFMTTRDTQRTSEDQMQMIADARFAMETIAYDLRHAGIWGGTNETNLIRCGKGSSSPCPSGQEMSAATDDCFAAGDWYIDLGFPVRAYDNTNPFTATCATEGYKAGTDVLEVRYADSLAVPTGTDPGELASGVAYIRSNIRSGQLFEGNAYPASTGLYKWIDSPLDSVTKNYPFKSPLYYVSSYTDVSTDGVPSLHRVDLGAGPAMVDKVLIPGVEDLQLEFGLDINTAAQPADGQVDIYVNAGNVVNTTWGTNWQNGRVIAVKIWLLMRVQNADRDGVVGSQTFKLAGDTVGDTYTDGVRRFLMTSVVQLRNTVRVDLSTAGGG